MFQNYYQLPNGKQAIYYINKYKLSFNYGNAFKYITRCAKKVNNTADSDLNKALVYITSIKDEMSFAERFVRGLINIVKYKDEYITEKDLQNILVSIIKFEEPDKIARMLVKYMDDHGVSVNPEYYKYRVKDGE